MLKKIPVASLRLGMHLHALEGSWLDHPFWRSKFLLTEEADRQAVMASGVRECWIDVGKGIDLECSVVLRSEDVSVVRQKNEPRLEGSAFVPMEHTTSFEEELERAAKICRSSKDAMKKLFGELRMGKALDPHACIPLVEELSDSVFRNPGALVNLARLKTKDDYTYMHSVAVCALMVALGRETGMDKDACREAGLAGLLHDVGKAAMPLEILNKPGKLSDGEFELMRSHPERGHAILGEGGAAGHAALDVCLHHHERVDGTGYPDKLAGESISKLARMGAICDVYDAISSVRPYKAAWDPADSLSRMASWTGHFDTKLFASFVRSLGIYPSGSLVRLRSGRLAVVVKQHPKELTSPTVKAFFSTKSNMAISVVEIDLSRKDAGDAIIARESRADWGFANLDALWTGLARI